MSSLVTLKFASVPAALGTTKKSGPLSKEDVNYAIALEIMT